MSCEKEYPAEQGVRFQVWGGRKGGFRRVNCNLSSDKSISHVTKVINDSFRHLYINDFKGWSHEKGGKVKFEDPKTNSQQIEWTWDVTFPYSIDPQNDKCVDAPLIRIDPTAGKDEKLYVKFRYQLNKQPEGEAPPPDNQDALSITINLT